MEPDILLKNQFIRLYTDESDAVFRFCFFRTSDREVAIDLMQETFTRFWDVFSQKKTDIRNQRAFLFSIARNCVTDWYRKKKSLSLESLAEDAGTDVETFLSALPQKEGVESELAHEAKFLMEKMREMSPLYRQPVYLRFVEGLGPKDIAKILGKSANVVSVRIYRGIAQLKKLAGYDTNKKDTKDRNA